MTMQEKQQRRLKHSTNFKMHFYLCINLKHNQAIEVPAVAAVTAAT